MGEGPTETPNLKDSMEVKLLEGAGVVSELGPSSGGSQQWGHTEENGKLFFSKKKMDLDHCFWSKKRLISMNGLREEHHLWTI